MRSYLPQRYGPVKRANLSSLSLSPGNIALRALLPSSLFLISLNQFQPKLASNLSSEISTLTLHNLPQVHHSASLALSQLRYSRDKTLDTFAHGRRVLEKNVHSAVGVVENTTGLKLANVWSTAKREMTPKEGSAGSGLVKRAQDALARAEGSSGASSEPVVVVSKTPVADAIVPLFDQHSEAQTLPGTNATISHTAPNALPSTTLAVPVYRQTSPSTPSGVQERVAEAAAGGLTVLENKMAEFADQARGLEKEGEKKAGELKERAGEALQRGEAKVKEVVGEVKREEKVVEAKVGEEKKALQTGYKKLV
jgi:hypothetical protein